MKNFSVNSVKLVAYEENSVTYLGSTDLRLFSIKNIRENQEIL